MKGVLGMVCVAAALSAVAQEKARNAWEDPAVNAVNRLPPRAYSVPLADEAAALTDALEPESPYRLSLNGTWKLSWAGDPALRVRDFWRTDFDDSDWFDIDVPSCVEMRGFGSPGYTNVRYPHADLSHPTNACFATIRDRQSGQADYNPVSSYRRAFTVPEAWKGRRVILRFDGVYSAYTVWVNGRKVGYAEDSKLPSEFDVTAFLNPAGTANLLAVEVFRWCDGSYLEDQDMTRFSGIFRDVTLWSMPEGGLWDFRVRTTPVDGYETWNLDVEVDGADAGTVPTTVSLYDGNQRLCLLRQSDAGLFTATVAAHAWSAEKPQLYTLVLKRGTDVRMKRIGFKEQKIVGNTLLVNGRKIKFKGVNRHETSPENGRTVSREEMEADLRLMKRYNVNTVRTSHYPNHRLWYDLCDRYGIYLVAEANVEGHEPGYRQNGLGQFPEWEHTIVERNERHVAFYRNHPSVTLWSLGNETGHGDNFRRAIVAVKRLDPTRPVHWERGNADADVDSRMYAWVDWLDARGKFGDGQLDEIPAASYTALTNGQQTAGKAFFMCEYAHAMGNAMGDFADYWDVFYRYDSLTGGCVWDWIDQAVWKPTGRIDPKTGKPERYLSYGGDFDESPNDGPFNCNGIIDPLRRVTPKLVEVGHVHRNLVVTRAETAADAEPVFELWNRFGFTSADEFLGTWKLRADGEVVKTGAFAPPAVRPLSRCRFVVPGLADALAAATPGAELFVDFEFLTQRDEVWAEKGWVVAQDQVALAPTTRTFAAQPASPLQVVEDAQTVTVTCGVTRAVFSRASGTLCELVMNGVTVLKDPAAGVVAGPRLTCGRAFTDNDVWFRDAFVASGLTQLRHHARPIRVEGDRVRLAVEVTGSKSAGFTHESEWTFGADGSIEVSNVVTPHGTFPRWDGRWNPYLKDCEVLPRLGLSLRLDRALDCVTYYGRGPEENYVDRCSGSFLGVWRSTVAEQFVDYVRPQDNGSKCDVRWVSFRNARGRGVRFAASQPLYLQALEYDLEDLDFARHRAGERRFRTPLAPRGEIFLNLDIRQLGLGGRSCGPEPQQKNIFPVQREAWTLRITPEG